MGAKVRDEGLDVREGALSGEEEEILDVDDEEGGGDGGHCVIKPMCGGRGWEEQSWEE